MGKTYSDPTQQTRNARQDLAFGPNETVQPHVTEAVSLDPNFPPGPNRQISTASTRINSKQTMQPNAKYIITLR